MIKGNIEGGLYPKIWVEVSGNSASKKFSMLVDTGFNADVALHHSEAPKLGLRITDFSWVDYADGERVFEPVCKARVLWHGKWKEFEVVFSNDEEPAVGTHLLQDSVVTLNFGKNTLTVEELSGLKHRK
jgi:predicted aspartyl protease